MEFLMFIFSLVFAQFLCFANQKGLKTIQNQYIGLNYIHGRANYISIMLSSLKSFAKIAESK